MSTTAKVKARADRKKGGDVEMSVADATEVENKEEKKEETKPDIAIPEAPEYILHNPTRVLKAQE